MKNGIKLLSVAALALALSASAAFAQAKPAQPSAAALAAATEILKLKGASGLYQGATAGMVQNVKNMLMQSIVVVNHFRKQYASTAANTAIGWPITILWLIDIHATNTPCFGPQ